MKIYVALLFAFILSNVLSAFELENETTWHRLTYYNQSNVIIGDYLFSCASTAIECFLVEPDGSLTLQRTYEQWGLVGGMQYSTENSLLYLYLPHYIKGEDGWLKTFTVNEDILTLVDVVEDISSYTPRGDFVYHLDTHILIGEPGSWPSYNKQSHAYEYLTYQYDHILGGRDNLLVAQSYADSVVRFYDVSEINNPQILCEHDQLDFIDLNSEVMFFSDDLWMVTMQRDVVFFDVSDMANVHEVNRFNLSNSNSTYPMIRPQPMSDSQWLFLLANGDYWVYDLSDYMNPVELHHWCYETPAVVSHPIIHNGTMLYQNEENCGILAADLSTLPAFNPQFYGHAVPFRFSTMIDDCIYEVRSYSLYKINPQTQEEIELCPVPIFSGKEYYVSDNFLYITWASFPVGNHLCVVDLSTQDVVFYQNAGGDYPLAVQNDILFYSRGDFIDIYEFTENGTLQLLQSIDTVYGGHAFIFDDDHVWLSYCENNKLYNTQTKEIEYEYGMEFMNSPYCHNVPYLFGDRLIVSNLLMNHATEVRLYDVSSLENPVLLDTKMFDEQCFPIYCQIGDELLECISETGIAEVFTAIQDAFTSPTGEVDFGMLVNNLYVDEIHQRIGAGSYYFFKTFLYTPTAADPQLAPLPAVSLGNYPNPFKPAAAGRGPATTIYFETTNAHESAQIEIFNVRGQKVKELKADMSSRPQRRDLSYSTTWDGCDSNGTPVAGGVYLYQLKADGKALGQSKMLLLK
jgi:hypothetical protein